jgi:hypothetical protein
MRNQRFRCPNFLITWCGLPVFHRHWPRSISESLINCQCRDFIGARRQKFGDDLTDPGLHHTHNPDVTSAQPAHSFSRGIFAAQKIRHPLPTERTHGQAGEGPKRNGVMQKCPPKSPWAVRRCKGNGAQTRADAAQMEGERRPDARRWRDVARRPRRCNKVCAIHDPASSTKWRHKVLNATDENPMTTSQGSYLKILNPRKINFYGFKRHPYPPSHTNCGLKSHNSCHHLWTAVSATPTN